MAIFFDPVTILDFSGVKFRPKPLDFFSDLLYVFSRLLGGELSIHTYYNSIKSVTLSPVHLFF